MSHFLSESIYLGSIHIDNTPPPPLNVNGVDVSNNISPDPFGYGVSNIFVFYEKIYTEEEQKLFDRKDTIDNILSNSEN